MEWRVEDYRGNGENIRLLQVMESRGVHSIKGLARVSGISERSAGKMIHGVTYPRLDTILLVCKALNCTIDSIYPLEL